MKSPRARPGPLILVVEDDTEIRRLLVYVLRKEGYRVAGASNGSRALAILRSGRRPNLILLDLRMPVMSGWDLLRVIQKDRALKSLPVIVLSGELLSESDLPHVSARLEKPVSLPRLLRAVRRHSRKGS